MSQLLKKSTRMARDQKLIEGTNAHLKGVSLVVANKTVTAAEAVATLQARIDATNAVSTARAALQNLLEAERKELADTKQFVLELLHAVKIRFSGAADVLADFGISPPKTRKVPSPEKKALAVKRGQATRAARHTLGPKQKLAIKGVVHDTATEAQVQAPLPPPKA
jgi:hypothetical protein